MKIKISTGDYPQYVEFPITGIHFSLDENNHPIDIIIYGQENILTDIRPALHRAKVELLCNHKGWGGDYIRVIEVDSAYAL